MADFNIRTDAVDVEQIMRQIRARIQEKRGVDYTEEQIQELANVKLERFLDPKGVRSDLVEQFKRAQDHTLEPFEPQQYAVDANDLYGSSRLIVRFVRKLLHPILKIFLNSNRLLQVLHQQMQINAVYEKQLHLLRDKSRQGDEVAVLYYELVHNLVLELTRVGIESRNIKMRLESLSSRMDFDERRARALEGVVQYRPGTGPAREPAQPPSPQRISPQVHASVSPHVSPASPGPIEGQSGPLQPGVSPDAQIGESSTARRRRRRRRGRRGARGLTPGEIPAAGPMADVAAAPEPGGTDEVDTDSGPDEGADPSAQ